MTKYESGQRWIYRTRKQDVGSKILIGKVQKRFFKSPIIHIAVEGITSPGSIEPTVIWHMPFSEKAMDASVVELVESSAAVKDEFDNGYNIWKSQKGGVFDLTVAEAVEAVSHLKPSQHGDSFDDVVSEMRSKKSEELIEVLYRKLFALDHWYFLCEPDNAGAAVQWEFPEGHNPTPALLAFTSLERAGAAAVELGIYSNVTEVNIMPAKVKDAVAWISGPDCANTWICFNLTQMNFPLYCDDAGRFLQNS